MQNTQLRYALPFVYIIMKFIGKPVQGEGSWCSVTRFPFRVLTQNNKVFIYSTGKKDNC